MKGAIIGDIVGSVYEHRNIKTKEFEFVTNRNRFTDDTVMTVAVANALLTSKKSPAQFKRDVAYEMHNFGRKYIHAGYGSRFMEWILQDYAEPYYSYGNGSAMRASACGLAADSLEEALQLARISAEVTHDHPDGIKGAQAIAVAVYQARHGASMEEIKEYCNENFYPLNKTLDDIRPSYGFDVSCKGSVPWAIEAFLESSDFEDAIRNAVSIGGDSDTIADMAGAVAWVYYGMDNCSDRKYQEILERYLTSDLMKVVKEFYDMYGK